MMNVFHVLFSHAFFMRNQTQFLTFLLPFSWYISCYANIIITDRDTTLLSSKPEGRFCLDILQFVDKLGLSCAKNI